MSTHQDEASKVENTTQKASDTTPVDTLVIGAGLAGIYESYRLRHSRPTESLVMLESQDRVLGMALSGLHLVDAEKAEALPIASSPTLGTARIRWEKQWVSFNDVDWQDKSWIASLPQWTAYLRSPKRVFLGLDPKMLEEIPAYVAKKAEAEKGSGRSKKKAAEEVSTPSWVVYNSPVTNLVRLEETSHYSWKAETPDKTYVAKKVIWAAGLTAFQNALGKVPAQAYLTGNPMYQKEAADYLGGISLTIEFKNKPTFEAGFCDEAIFGLPVRHDGKLSLLIGALTMAADGKSWMLQTLTHVPNELITEPKDLLSFQKSLKRSLKHILSPESAESFDKLPEKWVVSPRAGANMLGNPWCFATSADESLIFVGDQTLAAAETGCLDICAALLARVSAEDLTAKKGEFSSEALQVL